MTVGNQNHALGGIHRGRADSTSGGDLKGTRPRPLFLGWMQ
jgi:hypothetical protein